MIANILLATWAAAWIAVWHAKNGGLRDALDVAALACLVVFPCVCVLAARHLP